MFNDQKLHSSELEHCTHTSCNNTDPVLPKLCSFPTLTFILLSSVAFWAITCIEMLGKANGSKQESKNKNKQANKPTACGSTQRKRENREE